MNRVLLMHAHPDPSRSQVNAAMLAAAREIDGITVVDLYADYPRFKIDIDREQQRLQEHDVVVLQFPVYWYSTPALLKEWQDQVLEFGFAYGPGGHALQGKSMMLACTAGGAEDTYQSDGRNRFTLRTLLSPLEQTANLCQMRFLPPLMLFAAHAASGSEVMQTHLGRWRDTLVALRDGDLRDGERELRGGELS